MLVILKWREFEDRKALTPQISGITNARQVPWVVTGHFSSGTPAARGGAIDSPPVVRNVNPGEDVSPTSTYSYSQRCTRGNRNQLANNWNIRHASAPRGVCTLDENGRSRETCRTDPRSRHKYAGVNLLIRLAQVRNV